MNIIEKWEKIKQEKLDLWEQAIWDREDREKYSEQVALINEFLTDLKV